MMLRAERLAWLGLAFFVLVFLTYVGIAAGLPRYLLAQVFSTELQQPVTLAENPQISVGGSGVAIDLQGLAIGKRLLQIQSLRAAWSWRAIRRGRWMALRLRLLRPVLHGPWPTHASSSGAAPTLPAAIEINDGQLSWPLAGQELQLDALHLQYQAQRGGSLAGLVLYAGQSLQIQGQYKAPQGAHAGALAVEALGSKARVQMRAQVQELAAGKGWGSSQGTLCLVWGKVRGSWQWQGLRYAPQQLQVEHWRLLAQPQLQGQGSLALNWQKSLTVQADLQLASDTIPSWLDLLRPQALSPRQAAALTPAALQARILWVSSGAVEVDALRGHFGNTHFRAKIQRPAPGTPWQVAATLPVLRLDPWLSAQQQRAKPFALPQLPANWPPLRGTVQIGLLSWGKWQARQVRIVLQQAKS